LIGKGQDPPLPKFYDKGACEGQIFIAACSIMKKGYPLRTAF